ncbi:MAG: acyl-CoA dehydratase activase [Fidelibacterota bacterium]
MGHEANGHFLGVDLGSLYTKFAVVDSKGNMVYRNVIPTLSRRREVLTEILGDIRRQFHIARTCSTGYGRSTFDSEVQKTELICASVGVSGVYSFGKSIIDIGGEDIKIIESGPEGEVNSFTMNDKCSAGTGAFITEIAEKAELDIEEMSDLARKSSSRRVINSFCTVFAKTEILGWKFDGVPIEDMARGIYLSIVNRICKLPLRTDLPLFLCGGVIAYHSFLRDLLAEEVGLDVQIFPDPLYAVALGAATLAHQDGELE